MRDTYADTSLARADLGFRPDRFARRRIEAEYRWLSTRTGAPLTTASRSLVWIVALCSLAGGVRQRCRRSRRSARWSRTSSCSSAAPRTLNKKHWLTSREYFRQLMDSYPQSQYRADAKLGLGDTYLGEGSLGIERARDQRVPRVPVVLPDPPAARITRSTSSAMAHFYQMHGARARPDRNPRGDHRADDLRDPILDINPNDPDAETRKQVLEDGRRSCARHAIDGATPITASRTSI